MTPFHVNVSDMILVMLSSSARRAVAEESLSVIVMDYDTVENLSLLHPVVGARFFRALAISSAERLMPYLAPIEEPNAR
jgi:hypothetical protein